jgi:hypothetical protein
MLRFIATECGSNVESGSVLCGASNSQDKSAEWHSFIICRAVPGQMEDDGPYFELDDQSQGFHTMQLSVEFDGNVVTVRAVPPKGRSFGHRAIVVDLGRCPASQIKQFKKGLKTVFHDMPDRLILSAG